jgi:hypothetical protein
MMITDANAYSYTIARMDNEGNMLALESFDTYSEAEMMFDSYCDMYPHAYVDIVSTPE